MDQLEYADTLGFDGIGVNEHHQNGYGLMPSPNIIAAGLARRTSKAALCVIGNSIALYNPPIRVAEEFAMLDVISGGRLVAGFPVGTPMDTNFCYGQIPALTRDKYDEAHELIMRAWAEDEPFAFDGKYTQLRYVNCWPKPIQKPHPPIYIPGGGSIETWDFCLDYDYNYSYLSFTGYKRGKQLMDGYWERVAQARQGRVALPRRLRADHLRRRDRRGSRESSTPSTCATSSTAACTSIPASPTRRAIARSRRSRPARHVAAHRRRARQVPDAHLEGSRRRPLRHRRQPGDRAPADGGADQGPARRPRLLPASTTATCRTRRRGTRRSCSPSRSCRSCATCGRSGRTTTAGGRRRWPIACSPSARCPARRWPR